MTVSSKVKVINKQKVQYLSILSRLGAGEAATEHRKTRQLVPSKKIKKLNFYVSLPRIVYSLYQLSLPFES